MKRGEVASIWAAAARLSPASALPWRVGTKVGRTIYDAGGNLIGVMDRIDDAKAVVAAMNAALPKAKKHPKSRKVK